MSDNKYMKREITKRVFKEYRKLMPLLECLDFDLNIEEGVPYNQKLKNVSYDDIGYIYTDKSKTQTILSYLYEYNGKSKKQINVFDEPENKHSDGGFVNENIVHLPDDFNSSEVKKPSRYNKYEIETIEMMKRIFGLEEVIKFCEMTAFKYRMRLGHKDEIELELAKEKEYLEMAERFKNER